MKERRYPAPLLCYVNNQFKTTCERTYFLLSTLRRNHLSILENAACSGLPFYVIVPPYLSLVLLHWSSITSLISHFLELIMLDKLTCDFCCLFRQLFLLFMSFSLAVEALHAFIQDESEHKWVLYLIFFLGNLIALSDRIFLLQSLNI